MTHKERNQILQFFKGLNCLEFHRLWERIFTLFLVKNDKQAFEEFYAHCVEEIEKIQAPDNQEEKYLKTNFIQVRRTLKRYLDVVQGVVLCLNPEFAKGLSPDIEINLGQKGLFINNFVGSREEVLMKWRKANMLRHHYILNPLLNYTKWSRSEPGNLLSRSRSWGKEYELDSDLLVDSPRRVKYWECCVSAFYHRIFSNERDSDKIFGNRVSVSFSDGDSDYLDKAFDIYKRVNSIHLPFLFNGEQDNFFFHKSKGKADGGVRSFKMNTHDNKLKKVKVAFGNTKVVSNNMVSALRDRPNITSSRYQKTASILKKARKNESDLVLFPECFAPFHFISSLTSHSGKHNRVVVSGMEHLTIEDTSFNFVISIVPVVQNEIKDAVVIFRLKNHYSPGEEELIAGNHFLVPKPDPFRYNIINWRNFYFSTFYCFELADISHRSLLRGKVDMIIGVEYNRDTSYFSNIVESCSRDLHCYFAQVNSSDFGDTRLTQPVASVNKDILKLKGGINDAVVVGQIDVRKLREFQRISHSLSKDTKEFKPLPPDFRKEDVLQRIKNKI